MAMEDFESTWRVDRLSPRFYSHFGEKVTFTAVGDFFTFSCAVNLDREERAPSWCDHQIVRAQYLADSNLVDGDLLFRDDTGTLKPAGFQMKIYDDPAGQPRLSASFFDRSPDGNPDEVGSWEATDCPDGSC